MTDPLSSWLEEGLPDEEEHACQWETSDGPCPNLAAGTVQIRTTKPVTDDVINDTGQRWTCDWHMAQLIRDPLAPFD